ncbi:cytochrome c biogenesis protein [Brevibacillus humidisoli]|uniref:cytochrome C assembly family protein n=1 Tax=Brevibacillus humidisoli TaxID=2895522 RepID=UPI001E59F16D|nr:cytochrome c biogenesis protein CcsA [Brevibacillus humidisoli]UFJ39077.1 cytochrome c biogenesis protein [Brevibacillus humidisoli]
MADARWIYDLTIFLYAASVLFYFNDFLLRNRKANLIAFGLLAVVWLLQTAFFVSQMAAKEYFPVLTLFETLFFYSWVLATVSLVINYFFRIDLLVFFVNVIGFVVLVLSMFFPETTPLAQMKVIVSELLFIHITIAILSYAAFSLSLILSVMFLLQHNMLKQKKWSPLLRRLPSLGKMELFSHRMNMVGVPMLFLAMILGAIWAYLVHGNSFWLDPKVWMSLLVLLAYSILLYKRSAEKWQGRKLAVWNLAAFSILLLNVLSTDFSKFHQWL